MNNDGDSHAPTVGGVGIASGVLALSLGGGILLATQLSSAADITGTTSPSARYPTAESIPALLRRRRSRRVLENH